LRDDQRTVDSNLRRSSLTSRVRMAPPAVKRYSISPVRGTFLSSMICRAWARQLSDARNGFALGGERAVPLGLFGRARSASRGSRGVGGRFRCAPCASGWHGFFDRALESCSGGNLHYASVRIRNGGLAIYYNWTA
jgi:hypothetical protein